jgi:hypothetical protein
MSRTVVEDIYVSQGGKVPVKWTAPEVNKKIILSTNMKVFYRFQKLLPHTRPYTTRDTPPPVMCGALVVSCMRYGASDTSHLRIYPMLMYE